MTTLAITRTPLLSPALTPRARSVARSNRIGFFKRLQIAQMTRALSMLTDSQLEAQGIQRDDVARAAREMILQH